MKSLRHNKSVSMRVARKQGGIVLIMALILLVVISTVAVLALRNAMSGEQVSNNLRTSAVATQAAETGLRYCEQQTLLGLVIPKPYPGAGSDLPTLWATRANWIASNIIQVPATAADSTNTAGRTSAVLPICMVEVMNLLDLTESSRYAYLVTARGFSQDYRTNSDGLVIAGSEVWMQSILRY